jgi:photosystem II stability/assembly factor-like uncharacterized protein
MVACTSRPAPAPAPKASEPEEATQVPPSDQQGPGPSIIVKTVQASVPPRVEPPWIKGVAFATPERGWLLLDGQSLVTPDGGKTWYPAALPEPFDTMSFATPQIGFATAKQQVFRTTDGGEHWAPVDASGWPNPGATFVDERHGWSTGWQSDTFYRTQDGGQTWEHLPDPCPKESRRPFNFISPTEGWLLCGFDEGSGFMSKRLYRTDDSGLTWTLLGEVLAGKSGEPWNAQQEWPGGLSVGDYIGNIAFTDDRHGWYTGIRYGDFMATEDGGRTWRDTPTPPLRGSNVGFATPAVGYRFGFDTAQGTSVLTMTRDGGKTWTQVYPHRQPLHRFYLDARSYIGELNGDLYRSDDAGATWRLLSDLPAPLFSLSYINQTKAWALMGTETERHLYRSADGGATWQPVAAIEDLKSFQSLQGVDDQTVILWDGGNRLLITQDGGKSFTAVDAPHDQFGGWGFFFTSADKGWFSRNTRLHTTADGGKTWQSIPLPEHWVAQGVTVGPDGRVWASIVDTTDPNQPVLLTLASGDGGKAWTRYDLGDFNQPMGVHRCGLTALCVESGGGNQGIVSHDGGQTWTYYAR